MCGGILTESVLYACLRLCTGASPVEGSIWGQEVEYSNPSCLLPLSICIPLEPTWFVTGIKDARKNCMLDPQETPYWKGVKQSYCLLKSFSGNLGHLLTPTNRSFETRTPLKVILYNLLWFIWTLNWSMNQPQTWYDLMQGRLFWSKHLAAAEIRKWVSKYSLDQARDSSDKSCRSGRSDASAQHTWALLLCTTGSGLCYYVLQETWPASVGKYLSERCNTVHYMWWLFYAHYVCALHARGKK